MRKQYNYLYYHEIQMINLCIFAYSTILLSYLFVLRILHIKAILTYTMYYNIIIYLFRSLYNSKWQIYADILTVSFPKISKNRNYYLYILFLMVFSEILLIIRNFSYIKMK